MIYKDRKQERMMNTESFREESTELLVELINELYATLEVLAILLNSMIQFKLE